MNVTLCSSFRNSEATLGRYHKQVCALSNALERRGDWLSCVWGEGDSTDETYSILHKMAVGFDAKIVDCTHGGPVYGSIVDAQRFKQLAYVGNRILASVPDDSDVVAYVESDLIWTPATLAELLNHLRWRTCVAPMIMEQSTGGFFDTWAYRKDGVNFQKHPPYFAGWPVKGLVQVDSVGSCWAMKAELARKVSFPKEDVVVGLCAQIRALGEVIYLDSRLEVFHA